VRRDEADSIPEPPAEKVPGIARSLVGRYESLGLSHLLVPQRWWGSGEEIEGSSLDCLAMTAWFAAHTERLHLVTAVHPGFFDPAAIAKWGATLDLLSGGRWAANITSGWNLREFEMYGVDALDHDARYLRSAEFIQVLRGAWSNESFSFHGEHYRVDDLRLEPRPQGSLEVFQGGQSPAAIAMAAEHSDWMFLNGGSPERIEGVIRQARAAAADRGRELRFAMYAAPLCRATDVEAWGVIDARLAHLDPELVARRRETVAGAKGMWSDQDDPLSLLDTNEGYAARLIGSPETVLARIELYRGLGVEMLHLDLRDDLFVEEVLPELREL
jgi:FMNH2-dependent dimethyl sulfone monooxygenase